ncbi:MAG: CoA transferase [Solirubrobacterales bacterium]
MAPTADAPLGAALRAVGLPSEEAERLEVGGERGAPSSRLPVDELGVACVGAALLAAGDQVASLDRGQLRAALVSERLFFVDGARAGAGFAPASRFWPTADGWIRTHANYPWHHAALLRGAGAKDDEELAAAIAARSAEQIEDDVFAAGGVTAAVRGPAEWLAHPQGAAVATEPLVAHVRLGDAEPRPRCALSVHTTDKAHRRDDGSFASAAGVRVLDLTRVIAGPVCSRYLGALGADVLRLDPPNLPDLEPGAPADTLLGKRSAFLDLGAEAGARRLEELLGDADVVLLGYRPGALARFGLAPEDLAARHPGLVVVELSAWGHTGPWAERRGFDSIVQAASGIASVEGEAGGAPGALPCQLLDHGTGYLAAAAALAALAEQRESGGTHLRRLSLARTAHWLLGAGGADDDRPARGADEEGGASGLAARPVVPGWHEAGAAFVAPVDAAPSLAAVPPPGSLFGAPLRWPGAARYGADEARWSRPDASTS